jgi:diacylglycerol kinase (ATP)
VTRYGLIVTMIGVAATISWQAQRVPLLKRLGPVSYVIMSAITVLTHKGCQYRVRIDDDDCRCGLSCFAALKVWEEG